MILDPVRSLWREPAAPGAQRWSRWDALTIPVLLVISVLEVVAAHHEPRAAGPGVTVVAWPVAAMAVSTAATILLVFRRVHPLAVVCVGWLAFSALHAALAMSDRSSTMVGGAAMFVALYALTRWASGRQLVFGILVSFVGVVVVGNTEPATAAEMVAGVIFWLMPVPLGVAARVIAARRAERIREARLHERHQLARELHDTVAHHVSAIAIQAQAGQAVAAQRPAAAVEALAVIEEAASRTLTEMRRMVMVLRESEQADLEPQRGTVDIERLAHEFTTGARVDVTLDGDLDDLGPSVEAGLYRLAQEAVTNARRHARHASRIVVTVSGDADSVRLVVSDDGEPPPPASARTSGFGLIGMEERAKLLGGTITVGPGAQRGWVVDADLPRPRVDA